MLHPTRMMWRVLVCVPVDAGGIKDSWDVDYQATLNSMEAGRKAGASHFVLLRWVRQWGAGRNAGVCAAQVGVPMGGQAQRGRLRCSGGCAAAGCPPLPARTLARVSPPASPLPLHAVQRHLRAEADAGVPAREAGV